MPKQPPQECRLYPPAKANSAVNFHHRHARVEALPKILIGIDINQCRRKSELAEQLLRRVAQVTTVASIQHNLRASIRIHFALVEHRIEKLLDGPPVSREMSNVVFLHRA